jgi:glutathione S-transferase
MTSETSAGFELKLERTLDAPVERVWSALTDAGSVARWYGPSDDFRIEVREWECRVGGEYRVAMHHKDGPVHTCYGVFRTIDAPRRIAYTWAWEGAPPMDTLVTFDLAAEGGKTRLSFAHVGFPDEGAKEQHRMGWTGSLERLASVVG